MIVTGAMGMVMLAGAASAAGGPVAHIQSFIREHIIVRVRTQSARPPARTRYKERKGPRCMATDEIAGAAVNEDDSVDFVMKGGTRLRAKFDADCPALDYYGGFYLAPTADRRICADRDAIHARSGGACEIERIRKLVPDK